MFNVIRQRTCRGAVVATALALGVAFTAAPNPAHARIDTGAAVGIGLGAFALGSAVGAASHPYYYGSYGYPAYGYGYGYYGAPAYSYAPSVSYDYYSAPTYSYYGSSYGPYYGYSWGY